MAADREPGAIAMPYRYLYAIVPGGLRLPDGLCGLDEQPLTLIRYGALAAAASATARLQVRPERAHLAAHHAVVDALMSGATVLPVAFGTIVRSEDALRQFMRAGAESIARDLARVQGTHEIGLRACLNVPDVFRYLVDVVPSLRALRDATFGDGRSPGHYERIELGRQVERVLVELRERHAMQLLPALAPVCIDICRNLPRDAAELLNLVCLLRREDQREFERVLADAAPEFDDCITFELSGPWAPHHFCSIRFAAGDDDVPD